MPALQVPADVKQLAVIRGFVEECAAAVQIDAEAVADMVQAVDEAATNIIVHGYRGMGQGTIDLEVDREEEWLVVRLRDRARPFDPTKVPPPDLTAPLEKRALGGLGIYLMRSFTDRIAWSAMPDGGNELTLAKHVRRANLTGRAEQGEKA